MEEYVHEVVSQLKNIAEENHKDLTMDERIDFFSDLLQSYGRTALILHGGAAFGLCHLGVAKALYEAGMLPKIICGSYIGALMAALICIQDEEGLKKAFSGKDYKLCAFTGSGGIGGSWRRKIIRFLKHGRIFDIRVIEECARDNFGDITFREAYEKSGLILNITVCSKRKHEIPVLLNYITSPDVVVWSAACASCSLSGLYDAATLLIKDSKGELTPWNQAGTLLLKPC